MASDNQAGWEWSQDCEEYYYSQLCESELQAMHTPAHMPAKPSYRMSFDDLIAELSAHKKG